MLKTSLIIKVDDDLTLGVNSNTNHLQTRRLDTEKFDHCINPQPRDPTILQHTIMVILLRR